jgi:alkanesulfonate monooxygenase SsuD/methylene tetrahydromethanopterin reductase-like flavin-dependent oxidoreductase (luciferase family)
MVRLGLNISLLPLEPAELVELARFAEDLGYGSVWTAEGYGPDAVVPAVWIAARTSRIDVGTAIMQMPGRTPANTAMTAATLDHMTEGRFRLGLGLSGPQVVEGWHGAPFPPSPLGFTEEYVGIVREVLRRE